MDQHEDDGGRERDGGTEPVRTNPRATNPFRNGIDRRRVLQSSAAVGAATTLSGCLSDTSGQRAPTVYVFNNGDRTLSIIDADTDELLETVFIGTTASFPANQYGTGVDSEYDTLWLNVSGGVKAIDQHTLDEVASIDTGFGPNYPNLTPTEEYLLVAAGGTTTIDPEPDEPTDHVLVRIDADRESDTFGEVTGEIPVGYTGPCDVTFEPSGEYGFVADIANETLTVVRVDPFEIAARVDIGDPTGDGHVLPFMCTASFDGDRLLVENGEGGLGSDPDIPRRGSESIWDTSDPEAPTELERITRDDGLSAPTITSEVDPETEAAYLFTPGIDAVTVIDLEERAVDRELDIGGRATSGAWAPSREKLYVPVQTANHVAVIDRDRREVLTTIDTGESPTGAVGGMVRPETTTTQRLQSSLATLGLSVGDREPTFCPDDNCYCG
ncbi:twin-arginine translocation signal domain-containing protein [Natronorubrum aibiense]|uniref:twin-arginine translocation signal domain-containing protein n=1 Tax=Natronorubrum aibiense TaxID=348826 RepID=UPI001D039F96|nr:twin-arginine translocation signal domain-containing protein [Natronorubrum aibiense]